MKLDSGSRAGPVNCALVGVGHAEKMPEGGGKLKSGLWAEKMSSCRGVNKAKADVRKPFSPPRRRIWRKRGVAGSEHRVEHPILEMARHAGLEPIPENAIHVSEYERKQQAERKVVGKAERKARQQEKEAQDRHERLERYRESVRSDATLD